MFAQMTIRLFTLQDKSTVFNCMLGEQTHVPCTPIENFNDYTQDKTV
jgi:hypothetical protein